MGAEKRADKHDEAVTQANQKIFPLHPVLNSLKFSKELISVPYPETRGSSLDTPNLFL